MTTTTVHNALAAWPKEGLYRAGDRYWHPRHVLRVLRGLPRDAEVRVDTEAITVEGVDRHGTRYAYRLVSHPAPGPSPRRDVLQSTRKAEKWYAWYRRFGATPKYHIAVE